MGYKRTVRCSYCHETGHNRSSCPQYKAKIERYRAAYGDDHREVRMYDEKKARKARSAKTRRCTYCGEQGHNRASCAKLKAAISDFSNRNAEYRANVLAAMVEHGIGPGAMVKMKDYWGDTLTFMIVSVQWKHINMTSRTESYVVGRDVRYLTKTGGRGFRLPTQITNRPYSESWDVVVKGTEEALKSGIPAGFLDGSLGVKQLFKDKNNSFHSMRDSWGDYSRKFDPQEFSVQPR